MMINPYSIKVKLALIIATLAIIMVSILSSTTHQLTRDQVLQDQGNLLKQVTLNMSAQLNQDMSARGSEITFLSRSDRIQDTNIPLETKQRILENIKKTYPFYAWIGITDTQGNIIVGTDNILVGKNVAKRDWFLLGSEGLHFGDAHDAFLLAKLMPKPQWDDLPLRLVDVSAPIKNEQGELLGVICGHLSLDWAFEARQKMLNQLAQPDVDMLVLNQEGKILMGTPDLPSLSSNLGDLPTIANTLRNNINYVDIDMWHDGTRYLTATAQDEGFGQYPGMGWMVVTRKSENSTMQPAVQMNLLVLTIGGVSTLLFIIALILVLKRQLNPLVKVSLAATQLNKDDWSTQIPKLSGKDEVSVFANTLTDMVVSMHQKNIELMLAQRVFDESRQGIIITDEHKKILRVNQTFLNITGYEINEVLGKDPSILHSGAQDTGFYHKLYQQLKTTGRWQGEVWNRNKAGKLYPEWLIINVLKDKEDQITNYIGIFDDITEKKEYEQRLVHLANYDVLTQLPNRHLMQMEAQLLLQQAQKSKQSVALMFIDLDKFKFINDSLGHPTGDKVLQEVSQRLQEQMQKTMLLARWGGDEFVVVSSNTNNTRAVEIANKLIDALHRPFMIDGERYHLGMSIGIALYPNNGQSVEHLLRAADTAMYQAKHTGIGGYHLYEATMNDHVEKFFKIDNALRETLESGSGLSLAFQPQYDAKTARILSVELLLRWEHPTLGKISPAEFIPVAEETGQMDRLGKWVIQESARCYQVLKENGAHVVPMSINVSTQQLNDDHLVSFIHQTYQKAQIPPSDIMIEVTESAIMSNENKALETLNALKSLGHDISVDDFGTGYACLNYIQKISPAELKIDQHFVGDMLNNVDSKNIIAFTLALANTMDIEVVVEGVETEEQLSLLQSMGENMKIQGYLFSKPVDLITFQTMLAEQSPD